MPKTNKSKPELKQMANSMVVKLSKIPAVLLVFVGMGGMVGPIVAPIIVNAQPRISLPPTTPRAQRSEVDRDLDRLEDSSDRLDRSDRDHTVRLRLLEEKFEDIKAKTNDIKTQIEVGIFWQKVMTAVGGASSALCGAVAYNARRRKDDDEKSDR